MTLVQQTSSTSGLEAASSDLEATLAAAWTRAFGRKAQADVPLLQMSVGLRRMTRFCKDVEDTLGVTIPPTALMRLGTARALTDAIARGRWPDASPLLLLRDGCAEDRLFIISAGSGVVLELADLISLIPFKGQIWALQLPGLDGECDPLTCIGEIASHYADSIVEQSDAGRCHVVGYSFGGLVAVETARRLKAKGRAVGLVGLIDTTCYERYWPGTEWARVTARRLQRRIAEARAKPRPDMLRHVAGRAAAVLGHVGRRVQRSSKPVAPERSIYYIGGLEPNFQKVRNASIVAWESFRPQPFGGTVFLFKSVLGDPNACDPVAIWRRQVSDLRIVSIAGSHTTVVRKPHASVLANEIGRALGSHRATQAA